MTDLIVRMIAAGGYLGIALLMALENIVPPIPSEVIMGFGGMAVARGQMDFAGLVAAGTVGTTIGNYPWFLLRRRVGHAGLRPLVERYGRWLTVEWRDVEAVARFFHARGAWVVFVFRFLPAFRTLVSVPAGMARMPHRRFVVATAAGAAIWNTLLAGAGVILDRRFGELDRYVGPAGVALCVLAIGWYLYRVVTWRPRA